MNNRTEFFECVCRSDAHVVKFRLDTYSRNDTELYLSFFLSQYHNFFGRLWIAIKYLFGCGCRYGHWDCILFNPKDTDRLIELLRAYKRLSHEKAAEVFSANIDFVAELEKMRLEQENLHDDCRD